jgi:hypothetical protein
VTVFAVGGQQVVVEPKNQYYFVFHRQGISIEITPVTHWWCAWLCSSTTSVDQIECSITLSGVTADIQAGGTCSDCGSMDVVGPSYWGYRVPAAYTQVGYSGRVRINGQGYEISGSFIF